jgi:hypothetical protein
LLYATTMFASGMQLLVACNYVWFFMQLQWIFTPFLGVYATMVQLWSLSSQPLDDFCDISSYIFDMHILIVACATKIGQLWSFGKLGTHFFVTSNCFFKHNWRTRESTVVVFSVCLELLSGTLNLRVGNPNGISFTLLLVVHNFSFADWALLEELQSPFCLLACLLTAFPD